MTGGNGDWTPTALAPEGQTPMPSEPLNIILAVLVITWAVIGHIYWFVFVTSARTRAMELEALKAKIDERHDKLEKRFDSFLSVQDQREKDAWKQREQLGREMGVISEKINWMTNALQNLSPSTPRYPQGGGNGGRRS